jgi:hypothetical protein
MYSSRFATNMTWHQLSELAPLEAGSRLALSAYTGPERQCRGTQGYPLMIGKRCRCPHAARYLRAGVELCGNCARRTAIEVVP